MIDEVPSAIRKPRRYAARVPIEERREQILDATLAILDRDGYDKATIDAIAREVGVTRPVIYGAFDGLGPILLALLDRQQARALTQLYGALPTDSSIGLHDLVTTTTPALHAMLLADPPTWRAVLSAAGLGPSAVRERVDADRDGLRRIIADLIAPRLAGRADQPADAAEVLAQGVVAALEHYARLVLDDPERWTAQRVIDALLLLLPLQTSGMVAP